MATAATQTLLYTAISGLFAALTVTAKDNCSYTTYGYNSYDRRYERMVSFKACQWGCCWKYDAPCCFPPVGLIVGCVIGGFLGLVMLIGGLCCCYCCYCRQQDGSRRRAGVVVRYPHHSGPGGGGVQITSTTASSSGMDDSEGTITTTIPPGVYQLPPSYEEVMAGEINPAFKPDCPPAYTPPQP
ncbi:hypothetical protein ACOMHN_027949 [Nucella lapillus]